uniref:Nucleoporin p58/p45 n=1 Tax=Mesocestoides corti TaxID=53468 RepID=A0A5K3EXP7_MESCO
MSLLATISGLLESKQQSDIPVSAEILTVVEELKKHLAEQKKQKDELNTSSNKSLDDLSSELLELQRSVTYVLSGLRRQAVQSSHMSDEVLKLERNSSLVQRTLDATYDFTKSTPELSEYFKTCISSFSSRVQAYKQEVRAIEDLLSSQAKASLTPKELAEVLRKLDDQFMALAAQLYSINEELSSAKAQFLRQHRDLGGKKPFLESASSAAKAPFDALLFDSEKRDGQTPYGPSPFATTMSIITGVTTVVPSVVGAPTTNFSLSSGNLQPTAPLATTATTGGFSFSTFKPTPPAATAFTLGGTTQTTSATTGGFGLGGFGAVSTSATASKGFGFGLGATNATGFGVTSTAPSLGFGVTSTTPSVGFGATSTTPSTNFGFGAPASTTGATLFGSSPAAKPGLFTIK